MKWIRKNAGQIVMFACYLLMGAGCGVITAQAMDRIDGSMLMALAVVLTGVYGSLFLHIVIHEAGHMIFGLMTGYSFRSFRVGAFVWQKDAEGRLRMGRSPLAGAAGQCLMAPPDLQDGKMPFVLYNLGGSLMNAVLALIAFAAACLTAHPAANALLLICALTGLVMALTNAVPLRMGAVDNDGYNIRAMQESKEAVRALWVQLKVAALNAEGVRLKDMPEEWFAPPTRIAMKNSLCAAVSVFRCSRLMDGMRFGEAYDAMQTLLRVHSGMVGLHRASVLMDMAYCELIAGRGQEAAEAHLDGDTRKIMKAMKNHLGVLRTEYALALLGENDPEKAAGIEAQFDKAAGKWPSRADVESERELMEHAREKAEERKK